MQEAFIVTSTEDDDINPESEKFILRDLSDNISPKDMIKLSLPNIIDQLLISEINNNIFNFDDIQKILFKYKLTYSKLSKNDRDKITNVLKKIDSNAPHETFLILDATTGQSAINQVEEFKKISPITGIIMTKLDGTAKGGILLAVGKKFKLPIVALGMGEKEDDLQMFNAQHYAKAIMIS